HQITFTRPRPDSALLRTSARTMAAASRGTTLATTRIGVKEKRSATMPIRKVEPIVPRPAPVPARPATDATARLWKRSAGSAIAFVESAAYEKVATAKQSMSAKNEERNAVGTSATTPKPPVRMTARRARPTDQPLRMRAPDAQPPAKLPRS